MNTRELVAKIERLTKERIAQESVVSLSDYRHLASKKNRKTILVIEDDESMRRALKRIFESDGYSVKVAADGTQLSSVLDDSGVDLLVLDIGLPWINGIELAQLLKEHEVLRNIPLIFVSGQSSEMDIKRGFQAGADDYIAKPFEIEQIKKAVRTLLRLRE